MMLLYLPPQDRVYVTAHEPMNVYDLGLTLFRDEVLHHAGIRDRLKRDLLEVIACERRGEIRERLVIDSIQCVHVHVWYMPFTCRIVQYMYSTQVLLKFSNCVFTCIAPV